MLPMNKIYILGNFLKLTYVHDSESMDVEANPRTVIGSYQSNDSCYDFLMLSLFYEISQKAGTGAH